MGIRFHLGVAKLASKLKYREHFQEFAIFNLINYKIVNSSRRFAKLKKRMYF